MKRLSKIILAGSLCFALALPAFAENKEQKRLQESTEVLREVLSSHGGIPSEALDKAMCVLVYPNVKKVGVGIGVSYGRGVLTCRAGLQKDASWSAPAMFTLNVSSVGPQVGTIANDYVLLIMTQNGAEKLLSGKMKLGADASAAAGPSGANAQGFNDGQLNADILTYARSRGGWFAGASLANSAIGSDNVANRDLYDKDITASQIVRDGSVSVPASAEPLIALLDDAKTSSK